MRWLIVLATLIAVASSAPTGEDCNYKPSQCPPTGNHKIAIPCKAKCGKYLQCKDGKLTEESCGIWKPKFNAAILDCDHSWSTDCEWFLKEPNHNLTCSYQPDCPEVGIIDVAIPCDNHCQDYAHCVNGWWELKTCSFYERFDHEKRQCKTKSKVDCDWWKPQTSTSEKTTEPSTASTSTGSEQTVSTQSTTGVTKPTTSTQGPTSTSTQKPTSTSTQRPPTTENPSNSGPTIDDECHFKPQCQSKGKHLLPIPCDMNCQKYVECVDGNWTVKTCLPFENFHPEKKECVLFWDVDCDWWKPLVPTTTVEPPTTPCDFEPDCPAEGKLKVADPCRCQYYYDCKDGVPEEKMCQPWESFDPYKRDCNLFVSVDCNWANRPGATIPNRKTTAGPTTTPLPTHSTSPTPPPTEPSTTTTVKPTLPPPFPGCSWYPNCPASGSPLLAIPCDGNCDKYIQCNNGKYTIETCNLWRKFDHKSLSCAWTGVDCDWYKPFFA